MLHEKEKYGGIVYKKSLCHEGEVVSEKEQFCEIQNSCVILHLLRIFQTLKVVSSEN
jgi:hypothetical protein